MIAWLTRSRKSITALVGAIMTWSLVSWVPDGHIDRTEWWALAAAILTALGVYAVSNAPVAGDQLNQSAVAAGYVYTEPVPVEASSSGSLGLGSSQDDAAPRSDAVP